jgi:hypothetical protein
METNNYDLNKEPRPTWDEINDPELEDRRPDPVESGIPFPLGIKPGALNEVGEGLPDKPDPEDYKWQIPKPNN